MQSGSHKFIGVSPSLAIHNTTLLKQELLLFDEIVFTDPGFVDDNLTPELELLIDKGLVSAADVVSSLNDSESYKDTFRLFTDAMKLSANEALTALKEIMLRGGKSFDVWNLRSTHVVDEYAVRLKVLELVNSENIDAVPIFFHKPFLTPMPNPRREEVLRIVLGFLPTLENTTPIEQILEFRSDPDSRRKFLSLRNFMNDIGRSVLMKTEMRDRIEGLICDYRAHMEVHRLKYGKGKLEVFITTTAKMIEHIIKLKIGDAIEDLFSVRRQKADILEAELRTPGQEIAYLIKAQEWFCA